MIHHDNSTISFSEISDNIDHGKSVPPLVYSSEIHWAKQAWKDGFTNIAFSVVEGVVLVRGPKLSFMAEVFNEEGLTAEVAGQDAWVVVYVEDTEDYDNLSELLELSGFIMSPDVQNLTDGKMKREIMSEWLEDAINQGHGIPSMFPTERKLKPHQIEAVTMLSYNDATLLTDQVGLGKSGEFISAFLARAEKRMSEGEDRADCFPCVVVTKSSLKGEIVEEIHKWYQDATITVLSGQSADEINPAEFIVVNDAILTHWADHIIDANPQALIIDEAHSVNNPNVKRSKAAFDVAKAVKKNGGQIILASGTPFQNAPSELWGLLKILGVSKEYAKFAEDKLKEEGQDMYVSISTGYGRKQKVALKGKMAFEARWCDGHVDKWGHWINNGSSHYSELYQLLISNSMIRRKKSDVISPLPELHQDTIKVDLPMEYRQLYNEQETIFLDYMMDKVAVQAEQEGTDVDYAQHVLASKVEDHEAIMKVSEMRQTIGAGKTVRAIEWIHKFFDTDEITGGDPKRNKLIVFCHHKEIQKMLVEHPDLQKYGVVNISDANKSSAGIQEAKRRFQTDENVRLIICSSAALAGHTLTAAYDTLMIELLYGPVATMQAAGRNWARFSEEFEPHEAYFHLMVAMDTIDMATFHSNMIKKSLMGGYIDGEEIDTSLVKDRGLSLAERESIAGNLLAKLSDKDLKIVS